MTKTTLNSLFVVIAMLLLPRLQGIKSSRDVRVKLAISYALSQSTKLAIFEERVIHMVLETKNLPEALAESGKVRWHA